MSNQPRHKGRFIKQKTLDKRRECLAAMHEAKEDRVLTAVDPNLCAGRCIVELKVLGQNLKCCKCKEVLSLENVVKEVNMGLNSTLWVNCQYCSVLTEVCTGKRHVTANHKKYSDVDTKAVLGTVHAGIGCTALNKILACLNIPEISKELFKRYEREVGAAIEEAAKESSKRAAQEERRLVVQNIYKLCEEL